MRKKSHKGQKNIDSGRIEQKMKTRDKLLNAANILMINGEEVSVELVAQKAGTSKATAYRYFQNKDILQKEASLHNKSEDKKDLFVDLAKDDLTGRLDRLIKYHYDILINNETEFRLYLSAVIQDSVQSKTTPSRGGRRILLIEEALISLKENTSQTEFDKMVSAISVILGIESITILKDLCSLDNNSIIELWRWMIDKVIY